MTGLSVSSARRCLWTGLAFRRAGAGKPRMAGDPLMPRYLYAGGENLSVEEMGQVE